MTKRPNVCNRAIAGLAGVRRRCRWAQLRFQATLRRELRPIGWLLALLALDALEE